MQLKSSKTHPMALFLLVLITLAGCRNGAPADKSIRLIDMFKPEALAGQPASVRDVPWTEWHFDGTSPAKWDAGLGISGLAIHDGKLTGRTTTNFPVLYLQRTTGLDNPDVLHAVEIRMRVSAGSEVSFNAVGSEKVDLKQQTEGLRWGMRVPLVPGNEIQTYTLTPPTHLAGTQLRHLMLRPADVEGAAFEIESIRLVYRKEYLAAIPSGVTWQGLKEIYR